MDQDAAAAGQHAAQGGRTSGPCFGKGDVRRTEILDGPVMPFHVTAPDLRPQVRNPEGFELMLLDQSDHDGRVPGGNDVEIGPEVTPMHAGEGVGLLLAGCEGDADGAASRARL